MPVASRKSGRGGWRTEEGWETGQMCILAKRRRAPPPAQRRPALHFLTRDPPESPRMTHYHSLPTARWQHKGSSIDTNKQQQQ